MKYSNLSQCSNFKFCCNLPITILLKCSNCNSVEIFINNFTFYVLSLSIAGLINVCHDNDTKNHLFSGLLLPISVTRDFFRWLLPFKPRKCKLRKCVYYSALLAYEYCDVFVCAFWMIGEPCGQSPPLS